MTTTAVQFHVYWVELRNYSSLSLPRGDVQGQLGCHPPTPQGPKVTSAPADISIITGPCRRPPVSRPAQRPPPASPTLG
jgi:hypothetical protein